MPTPAQGKFCHCCGTSFPAEFRADCRDTCPKCQAYLHCCKNCRLYDSNAYRQCRSSTTEYVSDKEKSNFCEEFDWRLGGGDERKNEGSQGWKDLFSD